MVMRNLPAKSWGSSLPNFLYLQNFQGYLKSDVLEKKFLVWETIEYFNWGVISVGYCMFKVNNKNTRTRCKICSKLTTKTPEWLDWHRYGVSIINFWTCFTPCSSVSIVNFEQVNAGWDMMEPFLASAPIQCFYLSRPFFFFFEFLFREYKQLHETHSKASRGRTIPSSHSPELLVLARNWLMG